MFFWKATAAAAAMTAALTATPAMSQSTGFAEFVARIKANGTIANGSGIVSSISNKTGIYVVTFSRSVISCYPLVTVAGDYGFASFEYTTPNPERIKVSTFTKAGVAANRSFTILVRCQD